MYSTRTFVVPVVVFTVAYNVPKFFELRTKTEPVFPNDIFNGTIEGGTDAAGNLTAAKWAYFNQVGRELRTRRIKARLENQGCFAKVGLFQSGRI